MYRLTLKNIERVTDNEVTRDIYISKGYKLIEENNDEAIGEELSFKELKKLAKEKGIQGYSSLNKEELIELLGEL